MTKIKKLTEEDINPDTLNGQTLAYLGDAVYEVIIRRHLVCGGIVKPQVLQREATHYVSAKAQAALAAVAMPRVILKLSILALRLINCQLVLRR